MPPPPKSANNTKIPKLEKTSPEAFLGSKKAVEILHFLTGFLFFEF
jgi:hypothetical protein